MSTRVIAVLVTLFFLACGVAAIVRVRQFWSDDPKYREPQRWWIWSDDLWVAYHRGVAFGALLACVGFPLIGVIVAIWPTHDALADAPHGLLIAALVVWGGSLLGIATTVVLSRPKFLIPPMLRDDPNLLTLGWRSLAGKPGRT
jgi:hypothetical protein